MKCGNCGGNQFDIAMGKCVCIICEAEVDNEVAAAIHAGFTDESSITLIDTEPAVKLVDEIRESDGTA